MLIPLAVGKEVAMKTRMAYLGDFCQKEAIFPN